MKYEYYYVEHNGKSNCIIRTFTKLFNKDYETIYNELINIANSLELPSYAEIEVFEKYLFDNDYEVINDYNDKQIKDIELDNGEYAVFCYDKKDYYHMLAIKNNTIYDKSDDSLNLYIIKIYKKIK